MGGLIPEAIRKMESLRSKHDVELGVAMALLYFHGKAKMVDRWVLASYVVLPFLPRIRRTEDVAY